MSTPTLPELTTPLTVEEAKESIYQVLAAIGVKTTGWKSGAVVRTLIYACAIVFASLSELIAAIAKSGFLELAEGKWLTMCARYVYGVERQTATLATGQITITNSAGGVYDFAARELVFIRRNVSGVRTYRNASPIHIAAGTLLAPYAVTIAIEAEEPGSGSNALPGEVSALETNLIGVTVSNAAAVVGLDEENDPSLRTRCYEAPVAWSSNGPSDVYDLQARNAKRADGTRIGITRVRVSRASTTTGQVVVTGARPDGSVSGSQNDPATDLGALAAVIRKQSVPLVGSVSVRSASAKAIAVSYEVWVYNTVSMDAAGIASRIAASLSSFMSGQPIGGNILSEGAAGYVYRNAILAAIGAATVADGGAKLPIFNATLAAPSVDVLCADTDAPVLGSVTYVVHVVTG